MSYPKGVKEYILIKLETMYNKTQIAREVKEAFGLPQELDRIRKKVSRLAEKACINKSKEPIKRLFFDIETSYYTGWFWRPSWKASIGAHQVFSYPKIICISYKWQYEDEVHTLTWDKNQNDKTMLTKFVKVLGQADETIGHNIDKFDIKQFRTRCIKEGVLMFPKYRTLDTLKKARTYFAFPSNKLDYLGEFLGLGRKEKVNIDLWHSIIQDKDNEALKEMVRYCEQDVILTEDVFMAIAPYIDHNTNFAVTHGKDKWHCPECISANVKLSHTDTTPMGYIKRHVKCNDCRKFFQVSNKTYLRFIRSGEFDTDKLK